MTDNIIKVNSVYAWMLAARPKTLTGALAPVCVALSAAWSLQGFLLWQPALLCALFALFMQIDANLINDYLDFQDGIDKEDRLGPERACQQGWITPRAMRLGISLVTIVAGLVGLPLIFWGGWWMVVIGVACVIGCGLYSTLARYALGDILVIVFFGLVPVCTTYYLQVGDNPHFLIFSFSHSIILPPALAMGLVTDTLLLVNNYRDRNTDRRVGKHTIPNIIGSRATEWLYLIIGFVAVALVIRQTLFPLLFLPIHIINWRRLCQIHEGRDLNISLGKAAQGILLFALMYSVGKICGI